MSADKPLPHDYELSVAWSIVFSLVSCGLYNVYWNYMQFEAMNLLLSRREYKFWNWLLLSIITCGIYHIYYEYKMGTDLYGFLKQRGDPVNDYLPAIGLLLSCFGLTVVCDAIYQHELNKLCAA